MMQRNSQTPLLVTKLFVPPLRPEWVPRARLTAKLQQGLQPGRKLILVSAPPGFGKTTLLQEWIATAASPSGEAALRVAWLSLDSRDNDPAAFLQYVVAALQTVEPALGRGLDGLLGASPLPSLPSLLSPLINELAALPEPLVLVLEDYHVVEAAAIHEGLSLLIDQLPPHIRLVVATRSDPPLPLARWRGRGQIVEVRTDDLRFTAAEAAALLRAVLGPKLSPEEVDALTKRTEGWAVGLQLASLSLQGQTQSAQQLIHAFSGGHHYVLDYLVEEVLSRQPSSVQTFLLHTASLERLSAPLCAAVVQDLDLAGWDSRQMLEYLERANLFLVPLDEERQWYRYHHLFADMLQARLRQSQPTLATELHRRAGAWLAGNGLVHEAMTHALAAGDWEQAGQWIEQHWLPMLFRGEVATVLRWLRALPEAVVQENLHLGLASCWMHLYRGEIAALASRLEEVEQVLAEHETVAEAAEPFPRAQLAGLRSNLARLQGDTAGALAYARQALELTPVAHKSLRAMAYVSLGQIHRDRDDPIQAVAAYREALPFLRATGNAYIEAGTVLQLAKMLWLMGQLRQAVQVCREFLRRLEEEPASRAPALGLAHVVLGDLLVEQNLLEEAEKHVCHGLAMVELSGALDGLRHGKVALARLRQAQGDGSGAFAALDEAVYAAEKVGAEGLLRDARARRASQWVQMGRVDWAALWLQDLGEGSDLHTPRLEVEHLAHAQILIARGQAQEAFMRLEQIRQDAERHGRMGAALEAVMLQALACDLNGKPAEALQLLELSLTWAAPEGYVRLYLNQGPRMIALLRQAAERGIELGYTNSLLSSASGSSLQHTASSDSKLPEANDQDVVLAEPLSERELEVLRLLASYLSNRAIAERLTVSTGTVKTHIHHIYGKLGVTGRAEAISRARTLQLL